MNDVLAVVIPGTHILSETHDGLSEIVPPANIHFDKANARKEYRTRKNRSGVTLTPKEHIPYNS